MFQPPATVIMLDLGGTLSFSGDIVALCNIDSSNLLEEMDRHPGLFAWIGVLAAEAQIQADAADQIAKIVYSDLSITVRDQLANAKPPKRFTEESLKAMLTTHPKFLEAQDKAAQANAKLLKAKALLAAMATRKDLIVARAYRERREESNSEVVPVNGARR